MALLAPVTVARHQAYALKHVGPDSLQLNGSAFSADSLYRVVKKALTGLASNPQSGLASEVSELNISEGQDTSVAVGHTKADSQMHEAESAPDTLARLLAQALLGAQPRSWPKCGVYFAEMCVQA
jgi:hypothetical protein